MIRLFLFEKEQVHVETFESSFQWKHIQFLYQDDHFMTQGRIIKEDTFFDLDDSCQCIWHKQPIRWQLVPLKKDLTIGRLSSCDLCWDQKTISSCHAKLKVSQNEIWIIDQKSTNGTYLNGEKLHQQKLEPLDHILIYPIEIYMFPTFCITNAQSQNHISMIMSDSRKTDILRLKPGKPFIISNLQTEVMILETPNHLNPPHLQNWFQAFGSSLMMIISTLISMLILFQIQSIEIEHMISMLVSSTSMSVSFLCFGWIQRKIHFREQIKAYKAQENQYQEYLTSCTHQIKQISQTFQTIINKEKDYILDFTNASFHTQDIFHLGIGLVQWPFIELQVPTQSYAQKNHPWTQLQDQWLGVQTKMMDQILWFHEGQTLWIQGNPEKKGIEFLFLQWNWKLAEPRHKWVWIVDAHQMDRSWLDYRSCQVEETLLWFESIEQFKNQKFDPHAYQWTFFSTKELDLVWPGSRIIFTEDEVHAYDQKIRKKCLFQNQVQKEKTRQLRYTLDLLQEDQESFWHTCPLFDASSFDLISYWQQPGQYQILAGMDHHNRPIYFDLSEHGQGPHVLIAGMTGSGKSQWMMHMLLQLSLYNAPQDLQYILVDFKGGAFGQYFYQFPHCAGYLTNLEDQSIDRFTKLLQVEIQKRQKKIQTMIASDRKQQAHIDSYNQKYREDRMSHLFLIIDEFAQLKSQYPDFMQTLKEMARIGRSLGIHLILSTQKPMGVIDEQIWANSKLKICFQVNSEADSQEILHDKQAAYLQKTGSFIAQVFQQDHFYQGQGLWFHVPWKRSMWHLDQRKEESQKETLFEFYIHAIEQAHVTMPKIIFNPIQKHMPIHHFLCLDDCQNGQQIEIDFDIYDQVIVLYKSPSILQEWLQSLFVYYQDQVIGIDHDEIWNPYVDTNTIEQPWDVWIHLHSVLLKRKGLEIVMINDLNLISESKLTEFVWRICLEPISIDAYRQFFQNYQIRDLKFHAHTGWLLYQDRLMAFSYRYQAQPSLVWIKREYLYHQEKLWIGFDQENHQHLYWSQQRVLLICYAQQSQKETIDALINSWKQIDPYLKVGTTWDQKSDLYILYMPDHLDFFQSKHYSQIQYDIDLLWMGLGLQDYAYLLHKEYVSTQKNVFWQADTMHILQEIKGE